MFPVRLLLAALLASALLGSLPAQAQDVIPPKVLIRRFPQGQFCALPVSISFVAPETPITVTFTAVQFVNDASGNPTWTEQKIDNVTIAPTSVVAVHTAGPLPGKRSENCYNGDPAPVPYFHFNGLSIDVLEQFDSNPTPRGWNLSKGGVYVPDQSAPRDVDEDEAEPSGGSVGIGDGSDFPDTLLTKSVSLQVAGLEEGVSYDLGAWWDANFVRFPHDRDYLTITITTDSSTPVAKKSWGALKRRYR